MNRSIENSPPHGLEEVYAEYRTYFVRIAVSYVRDRMVAEDLVSDTFLKIWESRTETTPRNLPAYLLTALKRKCLDYLRDQAIHLRIQQNMHQTSARVVGERIARLEANDPQNLMMSEALAIIERELRRMPEQRRRIFIAHRYEDVLPGNSRRLRIVRRTGDLRTACGEGGAQGCAQGLSSADRTLAERLLTTAPRNY